MYGIYHPFTFVYTRKEVDSRTIFKTPLLDVIFSGVDTVAFINYDTNASAPATITSHNWDIDGNSYKSVRVTANLETGKRYCIKIGSTHYSELIEYVSSDCVQRIETKNSCSNQYHDWDNDASTLELILNESQILPSDPQTETISIIGPYGETRKSISQSVTERLQYLGIAGFNQFFNSLKVNDYNTIDTGIGSKDIRNIEVSGSEQDNGRYSVFEVRFEFADISQSASSCCDIINIDDILNPENPDNNQIECVDFTASIVDTDGTLSVTLTDAPLGTPSYKWYRNGVLISTGTTATVTSSGEYNVLVQIGVCRVNSLYVVDNECDDFSLVLSLVGNELNGVVSNVPDGETETYSIKTGGVEVATALPYTALISGTYWVTVEAGECKKVKGIYITVSEIDCDFTISITSSGNTLTAVTDAPTPSYEWLIDRGGGEGKQALGTASTQTRSGEGVYFLKITNGTCSKEDYVFFASSDKDVYCIIRNAIGFEFVVYGINLLTTSPTDLEITIDGLNVTYTASTPTLASEWSYNSEGLLLTSEAHALEYSLIVIHKV